MDTLRLCREAEMDTGSTLCSVPQSRFVLLVSSFAHASQAGPSITPRFLLQDDEEGRKTAEEEEVPEYPEERRRRRRRSSLDR